ncbi:unnamed protein product [Adineta ricciae]|uniref:Neurotransmitter-gated ion-channel ligand-binding domain-containing protein n=1 Tax=Adineta ricciae TaxID=249248 RepID=A0A815EHW1_ADIRI|nr:unnamed protein product [Adineta ricciae]
MISPSSDKLTVVHVRLVFLRIGEIDTLNERYQAHASIESRWTVSHDKFLSTITATEQERLIKGKSISLDKYEQSHWHPQLYIENALGDLKEQIKYSAKINTKDQKIYICEHRIIKGLFWEKLELQHFPSDVQDLSISVTSTYFHNRVVLIADPHRQSGVNREAFVDQQEWSLYEHTDTEERYIKEFLFRTDYDVEDEDEGGTHSMNTEDRKRCVLTVTCHVARQSQYFFWNGFCLILLITLVSFCAFGLPLQYVVNRLQVSCTLLLTSISFRWTVNRSLPTISYLTSLDRYGILCIFNLILHSMWHSIISVIIYEQTSDFRVPKNSWMVYLDRGAFAVFFSAFVILHIMMITWLFRVPLKHRQEMKDKDYRHRAGIVGKLNGNVNPSFSPIGHDTTVYDQKSTII